MKEANQLSPATSSSASGVGEREEFPEDFVKYVGRELNLSQLEDTAWVFWSRRDDYPRSLHSDFDLNVIPDSVPKVKDKIRLAIGRIILHPRCGRSLIQYWAGTSIEGRTLLSTQNQPFTLGKTRRSTWWLCEYRMKSIECKFYWDIGENGEEELGHPGRVFRHKLPESAPDVQFCSLNGYPQCDDASRYQVVSWVLPVLEHSSQICVGVLELVSAIDTISDWFDKSFRCNLNNVFQELGLQFIDRGIQRWPPCNINRVGSPWPLRVEHDEVISQLTSDMPPNQASASVAHIKRHDKAYQEAKTVMVRAKYVNGCTIKFQLSMQSRLAELHQQVAKRLNLKADTYDFMHEDEDGDLVLMCCDEDLQDCICISRSLGNNSIAVQLVPKKPIKPITPLM